MTNEEIFKKLDDEWDRAPVVGNIIYIESEVVRAIELARQDEREKVLKAFADWLDGEGFPVPDRKLQEYIKYNL